MLAALNAFFVWPPLTNFLSVVSSTTQSGTTITIPTGAVAGNLAVIYEDIDNAPTISAAPTGWTTINSVVGSSISAHSYYKILTSADIGTTVTSNNTETVTYRTCIVYQGNVPVRTVTVGSVTGLASTLAIPTQTVTPPAASSAVVLIMSHMGSRPASGGAITTPAYSPTETGSVSNTPTTTVQRVYYSFYATNVTPASTTTSIGDTNQQILQCWYMQCT